MTFAAALAVALALPALVGCGSGERAATNGTGTEPAADTPATATTATAGATGAPTTAASRLSVVAAFYPLQWVAEQVGGDQLTVTNLTPPGAEPHDLELTPSAVARITSADLVVLLSGFQPAVDEAARQAKGKIFDAASAADLRATATPIDDHGHDEENGTSKDDHGHAGEKPGNDPHFWLDPLRLAKVADALATTLGTLDPAGASAYTATAHALSDRLTELDGEYRSALGTCQSRDLVTSHTAFGYLAERYGFTQVGIAGLSPDDEPSPADLAEIVEFVRQRGVRTIYFETLVTPKVAETIAAETGAATAVLDPLEGLDDTSDGDGYLSVMRTNLDTLVAGQSCR